MWNEKLDFSIVPIDDFKMVLSMKFFDQVYDFPLLATNSLSILDGSKACMVPTECGWFEEKIRSAMQFKKGCQEGLKLLGLYSGTKRGKRLQKLAKPSPSANTSCPQRVQGCDASRTSEEVTTSTRGISCNRARTKCEATSLDAIPYSATRT